MSRMRKEYIEKIYAGWLAKIIGIRLGAPVEGWSSKKIRDVYGRLTGYAVKYNRFAADDDSNGPLFFIRALEDSGKKRNCVLRMSQRHCLITCRSSMDFSGGEAMDARRSTRLI